MYVTVICKLNMRGASLLQRMCKGWTPYAGSPVAALRHMSVSQPEIQDNREVREVKIPVPWGHIAAKWWGPTDVQPILGIHGWQDNCGTFDTLVPLLSPSRGLLAIDCPGHGISSHYPLGYSYDRAGMDLVRRIVDYFKWDKVSILGHSMGSNFGFIYAGMYPDEVHFWIGIDAVKPPSVTSSVSKRAASNIETFLNMLKKVGKNPPSYTYDEIVDLLYEGSFKSPTKESCKILLKRGMVKSPDQEGKYYFSRDLVLKLPFSTMLSHDLYMKIASRITCPVLNIKGNPGFPWERADLYYETLHVIKKSARIFEFHEVEGTHHVHLNNPERVAPIINNFMEKVSVSSQ